MLYREIEVEKFWDLPNTDKRKKEKIHNAIMTDQYGASIKKDGEYIRAIYDTDGEIWILGRGTNAKTVKNLDKHLVFITEWLRANFQPGTCLLGELYVEGKTSRAIRAYTGSLVPKSLKNQKDCPPSYYIFDAWAINGKNLMNTNYAERMINLNHALKSIVNKQIEFVNVVTGSQNILDFIGQAFENGEEGVVLVHLDSIPAPGKRTAWKSIKIKKEFQTPIDCFFTGGSRPPVREYTGKEIESWNYWENIKTGEKIQGQYYSDYQSGVPVEPVTKPYFLGYPGSLEVGVFKNDKVVSICYLSGLSDELKEQFVNDVEKIIMKPITITGMEATDNSIRHPKFIGFREDIPIEDCQWSKIFGDSE